MATKVGDVFVALGFLVDDKSLRGFDSGIRGLTGNIMANTAAASAALYAIDRLVEGATNSAASLQNISLSTGLSTAELQKFAYAANAANSALSFDAALGQIKALASSVNQLERFGTGANIWGQLQVDPRGKTVQEIFNELAKATHGKDPVTQEALLNQVGMQGILPLLDNIYKNPAYVEQIGGPLALSDQDISTLAEADRLINNMKKNWSLMSAESVAWAANLTKGLERVSRGTPDQKRAFLHDFATRFFKPEGSYRDTNRSSLSSDFREFSADPKAFMEKLQKSDQVPFSETLLGKGLISLGRFIDRQYEAMGDTNISITVNGVNDPAATGTAVRREIEAATRQRGGPVN